MANLIEAGRMSVEQLADEAAARQAISALRLEFNRGHMAQDEIHHRVRPRVALPGMRARSGYRLENTFHEDHI
jgi:hypothetical protein